MWEKNKYTNLSGLGIPELTSDMLYGYLVEKGFTWGEQSSNWTLHTIWEPRVTDKLSFLKDMKPGEDVVKCNIWPILREGFGTFSVDFDSLVNLSDNMTMVRIDCEKCPKATELPSSQLLQGAQVSEFSMDKDLINFRCTPITLVAGGSLREILKACIRYNDVLIAVGTVKRVETTHAHRLSLLNYDCDDADLTLIRISFLPPLQGHDVKLLETITPADGPNTYKFKYRARCGTSLEQIAKFGVYHPNEKTERDDRFLIEDIQMPIASSANITAIYSAIVQRGINKNNKPATPVEPVPPPPPPCPLKPYRRVTFAPEVEYDEIEEEEEEEEEKEEEEEEDDDEEESYKTSHIFFSDAHPFRGERCHIHLPSRSAFWALVFILMMIFFAWGLTFGRIYSFNTGGSREMYFYSNHGLAPPINSVVSKDVSALSVMYNSSRSMLRAIFDSFMRILYWLYDNLGYRYITQRLFGNTTKIHQVCY